MSNLSVFSKLLLVFAIAAEILLHLVLLRSNLISVQTAVWGLVMQVLYLNLVLDFSNMKLQSPLFMSACAGIIVHKTLWYATAPRDHDEALDHDLCFCAAEACFCTGIIAGVLICVWAMPILLILAWEPAADGYDLGPLRRTPSGAC
uniref:Uncharacterized protein n=1 Tax=Cryptomonas curvata TaxID=233186 RepID=A0A7S0MPY8_9CRYP|mmetsp:Transcript_47098/g.98636  ORF Transcript_47098/g.98636 Transcript_47098/m.98636 type:complete len:147 (+) Transcript_47098:199-639(+)